MQANVFSIEKTHQHILFWPEIHSFFSITDRNYKSRALICVDNQISRTQLGKLQTEQNDCKTGGLHVHVFGVRPVFSRDQPSDKLINFLDSQLETQSSRLET